MAAEDAAQEQRALALLRQLGACDIERAEGSISGGDVRLTAVKDINNVGGTISGVNSVNLNAGHDINITTTTSSATGGNGNGYSFSNTGINRVAGAQPRPGTAARCARPSRRVSSSRSSWPSLSS